MFQRWRSEQPEKPASVGAMGERYAAEEYMRRGYAVVARNEYNRKGKQLGEIDLVVVGAGRIICVEVKTRTAGRDRFGSAAEAVTRAKQVRVLRAAHMFLLRHPEYTSLRLQVDVCLVLLDPVDKHVRSVTIMENSVDDLN